MQTVRSSDGVDLALHDLGGDGPPLLLCHATGFHGRVWLPIASHLQHRRCWALDFRGFGDSTPPLDGNFEWHGFGDDVLAVVDHLGLTDVQAVGHSKGGAALLLAEQARPGTFERLFLFEPIVFPPNPEQWTEGDQPPPNSLAESARRRRETFPSIEDAIENFASKPPMASLDPDALDAYVRHGFRPTDDGQVTLKADREHEARCYENGGSHRAFAGLATTNARTIVIGSGDGAGPAQLAPIIADQLPNGTYRQMADLNHFGPLQAPDVVASAIDAFLRSA